MKIVKESEETIVKLLVDMSHTELYEFIDYYDKNCPEPMISELKVNWAICDILKKRMEEEEKHKTKKKSKK